MVTVAFSLYRIQQRSAAALARGSGGGGVGAEGGGGEAGLRVDGGFGLRLPLQVAAGLLAVDLVFFLAVVVKDHVLVAPNEPTIQLPYIRQHIDATLRGYRLDDVETVDWRPPESPLSVATLLDSKDRAERARAPDLGQLPRRTTRHPTLRAHRCDSRHDGVRADTATVRAGATATALLPVHLRRCGALPNRRGTAHVRQRGARAALAGLRRPP